MSDEKQTDLEQVKKEQFDKLTAERDEYLNGWKRAKADLINYQKDEARRLEEVIKFANAGLIKELIPVLDSFNLANQYKEVEPPAGGSTSQRLGLPAIQSQLEDVLKRNGIERIRVEVGQRFDAAVHESVGESEFDQPAGTIAEIIVAGYLLHGRVLRPARVKISKGK